MTRNLPKARASWFNLNERTDIDYFFQFSDSKGEGTLDVNVMNMWLANIQEKLNKARNIFLAGKWDYFFTVDDDIILPPDALTKLLEHDKDVINALFRLRPSIGCNSLAIRIEKDGKIYDPDFNEIRIYNLIEIRYLAYSGLLLKRKIVESNEFPFTEILFSDELNAKGIKMYCDPTITCGHIDGEKIIYP